MRLILPVSDFNLEHTLECGQAFRWERRGRFYYGIIADKFLRARYGRGRLNVESDSKLDRGRVLEYFGLKEDLPAIYKEIGKDPNIGKAIKKFHGLRILSQDHWECLASFILSSYTNIPRIKKMITGLSSKFGERLGFDGLEGYSFPSAQRIARADIKALKALGLGFRAAYIKETAQRIASRKFDLEGLDGLNYIQAKKKLLLLKGVGEKVADCVLLFSFKRYEAFPVDTWIKRGMEDLYFNGRRVAPKKIVEFAQDYFGCYAGYAQQYLYHYLRCER